MSMEEQYRQSAAQQAENANYGQTRQTLARGLVGQQRIHDPYKGMNRTLMIVFVANGYIVTEHWQNAHRNEQSDKPPRVYTTVPALLAYLHELTVGGPGGEVSPVPPEQAGLDLGPVPDTAGDQYQMDASELTNLDAPVPAVQGFRHASDCAVYNEPASENGPCNCGAASGIDG